LIVSLAKAASMVRLSAATAVGISASAFLFSKFLQCASNREQSQPFRFCFNRHGPGN
jgi:hypothetical protein